jgi:hypothetical protein
MIPDLPGVVDAARGCPVRRPIPRGQSLSMFQNTIGLALRMPCTLLRAA